LSLIKSVCQYVYCTNVKTLGIRIIFLICTYIGKVAHQLRDSRMCGG